MSSELETLFWYPEDQASIDERFANMAQTISEWDQAVDEWQGVKVVDRSRQNVLLDLPGPLSLSDLQKAVLGFNKSTYRLVSGHAFRCWRFQNGQASPGYARIQLECWGVDYARRQFRNPRLEGHAGVYLNAVGPYCMIIDQPHDVAAQDANAKVEENLGNFTDLLFGLIEASNPRSAKVFVDEAHSLPFNAHVLYYDDASVVIEDLKLIDELWNNGLSPYQIPPLKDADVDKNTMVFHPWRTPEARAVLQQRLSSGLPHLSLVTKDVIQKVIASGEFDNYTMPSGTTVLEFPDFMNALLDRFYLAVLNASQ